MNKKNNGFTLIEFILTVWFIVYLLIGLGFIDVNEEQEIKPIDKNSHFKITHTKAK